MFVVVLTKHILLNVEQTVYKKPKPFTPPPMADVMSFYLSWDVSVASRILESLA